jgi:hypothetical protein
MTVVTCCAFGNQNCMNHHIRCEASVQQYRSYGVLFLESHRQTQTHWNYDGNIEIIIRLYPDSIDL